MRNIKDLSYVFILLLIWLMPGIAIAAQRFIFYEMGESGHTISFPMSQKEILAAEKAEDAIKNSKKRKLNKKIWVQSYELPESGLLINFPMSDKEINEAKAKLKKLAVNHRKNVQREREIEKQFEVVEMADGYTMRFKK